MLKKTRFRNWSLYAIADGEVLRGREVPFARAVLRAGIGVLQLRDHSAGDALFLEKARKLRRITKGYGADFIINDRLDIALAVDADGLHLGSTDLPAGLARRLLGRRRIIGFSTHSVKEAQKALRLGVDYISIGPVFPTPIKAGRKPIGISELKKVLALGAPTVAVGGINRGNIEAITEAGARMIAVIRALCASKNPRREAEWLIRLILSRGRKASLSHF